MNIRSYALLAAFGAALAAPTASQADSHHVCDQPIYIFSQTRAQTDVDNPTTPQNDPVGLSVPSVASAAIGCTVVRDTVQPGEGFEYAEDTDLIYPGANRLFVRFLENGTDPSVLTSATLTIGETVIPLTMNPGTSSVGAATWMDSTSITIDPALSVSQQPFTASFCVDGGELDDICYSRTYRTVVSQPLPA